MKTAQKGILEPPNETPAARCKAKAWRRRQRARSGVVHAVDLSDADKATLDALLRHAIAADRFPFLVAVAVRRSLISWRRRANDLTFRSV